MAAIINVLLVEDELLVRSGMRSLIDWNAHGFHLAGEASHGGEAFELLQRQRIDIVITDIRMPVMDGLQLIEKIREHNIPCEIIVLSSYDDFPYVRKAMTFGARDYIHKPTLTIHEFIGTLKEVAKFLDSRRSAEKYQRLILDAVEESREVVLNKIVSQAVRGEQTDGKVRELIQGVFVADEPFWTGALRFREMAPAMPLSASSGGQTPEQTLRLLVKEHSVQASKPVFMVQSDPYWLFLFAAEAEGWMQQVAERLKRHHNTEAMWETPDRPCTIDQLAAVLPATLANLNRRFEQREKELALHPLVKQVLEFIREHYHDNLSLERMSSIIHVSPVYLSRLFYKETGETFIDWLTKFRVEQAKRLLRETNLCAYEVADRIGYKNSKYFLRVFKKMEGVTPGEFRGRERGARN